MNDERQEENRRTAGSVGGRHDHRRAGDGSRTAPQRWEYPKVCVNLQTDVR